MPMNRLTWHHAASTYKLSAEANDHYHFAIDGDGEVISCKHSVSDNDPLKGALVEGAYAAHTKGLNSGNIGISILAMGVAEWGSPFETKYPVLQRQLDAMFLLSAKLVADYGIKIDRRFTLSHAEVQGTLGVKQKNKWDFDYYEKMPESRDPLAIGDEFRQEVKRLAEQNAFPTRVRPPEELEGFDALRRGSTGSRVKQVQRRLVLAVVDGFFGPRTEAAVRAFQKSRQLYPDGIVGRQTWAALFPTA